MAKKDFKELKKHITVLDIIHEGQSPFQLYSVFEDQSITQTIKLFQEKNITGLPVLSTKTNEVIGGIDTLDIVTFTCAKFASDSLGADLGMKAAEKFKEPVKNIINLSGNNKWKIVSGKTDLGQAIDFLSKPDQHRFSINNEHRKAVGTLTQSRLVHYLAKHKEIIPQEILHKKVKELWKLDGRVHTINLNNFVIDAFTKICECKVSSIGIVDDSGALVGNLSANDIKRMDLSPDQLILDVNEQLRNFLNIYSATQKVAKELPRFDPIFVSGDTTCEDILSLVTKNRVHVVFAVDDHKKPLKAISLSDIIAVFK